MTCGKAALRLGIDFDNTIVSYDALFHKVACEGKWIPEDLPVSKLSVRDYLRGIGKEPVWTEMQGVVYGARIQEAEAFPGVHEFMRWARGADLPMCIVSHKTMYPFIGPKYDLHEAARGWIRTHLGDEDGPFVDPKNVFFELTKEEKCARVAALGCTTFVDDLPELLLGSGFPKSTEPLLFDPDGHHAGLDLLRIRNWQELHNLIQSRW